MSLSFYLFGFIVEIILVFLFFLIIGLPVTLLILKLIDKKSEKITFTKKKRVWTAILINLGLFLIVSLYIISEPIRCDWALDMASERSNLSLPVYVATGIAYPAENNAGDDFYVDKNIKFLYSPSNKDVEQLEKLCKEDDRWTKENGKYHFQESIFERELKLDVIIDVENNRATTSYLKW